MEAFAGQWLDVNEGEFEPSPWWAPGGLGSIPIPFYEFAREVNVPEVKKGWIKRLTGCLPSYYKASQNIEYPSLESFLPLGAS